jgi:uncharacterized radical SAM superfamily protein
LNVSQAITTRGILLKGFMKKKKVKVKLLDFSDLVKNLNERTVYPNKVGNNLVKNTDVARMKDFIKGEKKDV